MTFDRYSEATLVSPLAWLNAMLAGPADAPAAHQIGSAEALAQAVPPGLAAGLGGADPAWASTTEGEAQAALEKIGEVCRNHCPIQQACVTDACRYYRLEGHLSQEHGMGVGW